jgi:hypothetical protein
MVGWGVLVDEDRLHWHLIDFDSMHFESDFQNTTLSGFSDSRSAWMRYCMQNSEVQPSVEGDYRSFDGKLKDVTPSRLYKRHTRSTKAPAVFFRSGWQIRWYLAAETMQALNPQYGAPCPIHFSSQYNACPRKIIHLKHPKPCRKQRIRNTSTERLENKSGTLGLLVTTIRTVSLSSPYLSCICELNSRILRERTQVRNACIA